MSLLRRGLLLSVFLCAALAGGADGPPARTDAFGDPLPRGVLARFGTTRLRDGATAGALSPDGKTWVSATLRRLRWWDVATGRIRHEAELDGRIANTLTFSPDGRLLAATDYDTSFHLRQATNGWLLGTLTTEREQDLENLAFSGDGRFVSAGESALREHKLAVFVWDITNGRRFGPFEPVQMADLRSALGPDGRILATWGNHFSSTDAADVAKRRTVQLWHVPQCKELGRIVTEGDVRCAAFSPDGRSVAVAGGEAALDLWETATLRRRLQMAGCSGQGRHLAFSADGAVLAAVSDNAVVQLWDTATGRRLGTYPGPDCTPAGLWPMPGQRFLAWGMAGVAPCLWDVTEGKLLSPRAGHDGSVTLLAFLDGGRVLASAGTDGQLLFWDPATGKERPRTGDRVPGSSAYSSTNSVIFAGGKYLARAAGTGTVRVQELPSGREVSVLEGAGGDVATVAASADGRLLAGLTRQRLNNPAVLTLWSAETGQLLRQIKTAFTGKASDVRALALSPDGTRAALGIYRRGMAGAGNDTEIRILATADGSELGTLRQERLLSRLVYAPNGRTLFAIESFGPITEWDVVSGRPLRQLSERGKPLTTPLVFSPDGRTVAAGVGTSGDNGVVRLWELATGKLRAELSGHRGRVSSIAFSPDGRTLAGGGTDTTVLLWDLGAP